MRSVTEEGGVSQPFSWTRLPQAPPVLIRIESTPRVTVTQGGRVACFNPLQGNSALLSTLIHTLTTLQKSTYQEPQWQNQHLKNWDLKSVGVPLLALMALASPSVRDCLLRVCLCVRACVCVCVCVKLLLDYYISWKSAFANIAVNYNKQKDFIKSTINRIIQKTPQNELCIPEWTYKWSQWWWMNDVFWNRIQINE